MQKAVNLKFGLLEHLLKNNNKIKFRRILFTIKYVFSFKFKITKMKIKILAVAIIAILFSSCGTLKKTQKTNSLNLALSELPSPLWFKYVGSKSDLTINDNTIYITGGKTIKAIDLENQQLIWKYKAGNGKIIRKIIENDLIVLHLGNEIHVIDKTSGELKWKTEGEISQSSIFAKNDILFYWTAKNGQQKNICAANINTGTINWTIDKGIELHQISDSTLVVGSYYEEMISQEEMEEFEFLTVYNSITGKEIWKLDLKNPRIKKKPNYSLMATLETKIFVSESDTLFAFDAVLGKQIWSKNIKIRSIRDYKNELFICNSDNLVCIDSDGKQKWTFEFDKQDKEAKSIYQIVENDMIYVENGKTYMFNANTGALLWKKDTILSAKNKSTYKKYPILLTSNITLIQTDVNTIKAYNNTDGLVKWAYKSNNKIYLNKTTYNNTLFLSLPYQGMLMACSNSDRAKAKNHKTLQAVDVHEYETDVFSSVRLPINKKWMINTKDKATAGANEFVVTEGYYGNTIRTLNWGSWKSDLEDTDAAISAVKASAGSLIRYNDYHFKTTGENIKIEEPLFTTKLVTLENGTKAVLVEAEIIITKPANSKILGNSYYARNYYFITNGEGEKMKFPVIASSAMFKAENYKKEKNEFQELIDNIANTAILR